MIASYMRPKIKPRPSALDQKYGPIGGKVRLTTILVRGLLPRSKDYHLSDTEVRGLKLKVTPVGHKTFILRYRNAEGRERKFKIGVFPDIPVIAARDIAKQKLAEIVQGGDPSAARSDLRANSKFTDFAEKFITEHAEVYLRPSTVRDYRNALKKHILPAIGQVRLQSIARQDMRDLHQSLAHTPYQANRVINLVRNIFNKAEDWEAIPPGQNPATRIKKYDEHTRDYLLSETQMKQVADVLSLLQVERPSLRSSWNAITLIFLTGLRLNEALQLSWADIDFERDIIVLRKTKTKPRQYPMVAPQKEFLLNLKQESVSDFLFPHTDMTRPLKSIKKPWDMMRQRAEIPKFRTHDIRHNIGSDMGMYADRTSIQAVLGHAQQSVMSMRVPRM
jgi:integrase